MLECQIVPRLEKLKTGVQQMLRFSTYEEAFEELLENEGLKKKAAKSCNLVLSSKWMQVPRNGRGKIKLVIFRTKFLR